MAIGCGTPSGERSASTPTPSDSARPAIRSPREAGASALEGAGPVLSGPEAGIRQAVDIGINRLPLDSLRAALAVLATALETLDDSATATGRRMQRASTDNKKDSIFERFVLQRSRIETLFEKEAFSLPEPARAQSASGGGWILETESDMEQRTAAILTGLRDHGFEVRDVWQLGTGTWGDQGEFFISTPATWYDSVFRDFGSPALKEYLAIVRLASTPPTAHGEFLWLGRKCARWEALRTRHPDFPDPFGMGRVQATDLPILFMGSENSPLADERGRIRPDIFSAYRRVVSEHPETRLATSLSRWLALLESWSLCLASDCGSPLSPPTHAQPFLFHALGISSSIHAFPGPFLRGSAAYFDTLGFGSLPLPPSYRRIWPEVW